MEPPRLHLEVVGLAESLQELFENRAFCSLGCVRAYFLETLNGLERLETPEGESLISDLRASYLYLASAFAALLEEWNLGHISNGPTR